MPAMDPRLKGQPYQLGPVDASAAPVPGTRPHAPDAVAVPTPRPAPVVAPRVPPAPAEMPRPKVEVRSAPPKPVARSSGIPVRTVTMVLGGVLVVGAIAAMGYPWLMTK